MASISVRGSGEVVNDLCINICIRRWMEHSGEKHDDIFLTSFGKVIEIDTQVGFRAS